MKTKVNNVYAFRKGKKTLASVAIASVFALGAGVVATAPVQTAHADDYIDTATKPTVTTDVPVTARQRDDFLSVTAKPDSTIVPDKVDYTATMTNNDTGAIWNHSGYAEQYRAQPDATADIYIGDAPDGNYTVTMTTKSDLGNVVDGTNYIYEGHTTIALDKGKVTTTPVTPSKPVEKPAETPVNEEAPGDSAKDQEPSTDVTSNGEEVKETPTEEVNVPVKEVETPEKTEEVETPTTENNSNGEEVKETPTKEEVAETPSEDEDSSKETPSENKPDTEVKPGSVVKPNSEKPQSDDTKVPAKPEATGTKNVTKADIKAGLNQVVTKAETAKVLDRRGSKNYQAPNTLPATGEASAASFVLAGALVGSFGFVGLKKRKN